MSYNVRSLVKNDEYEKEVYTTPNGATISDVISYDFNNLYGDAMRLAMPVGSTFKWDPRVNPMNDFQTSAGILTDIKAIWL